MNIPTDYGPGYEKARVVAPDIASNYVAHTLIGDPLAEEMTEDLEEVGREEATRFIRAAMEEEGEEALRGAPESLRLRRNGSTIQRSPRPSACFTGTPR